MNINHGCCSECGGCNITWYHCLFPMEIPSDRYVPGFPSHHHKNGNFGNAGTSMEARYGDMAIDFKAHAETRGKIVKRLRHDFFCIVSDVSVNLQVRVRYPNFYYLSQQSDPVNTNRLMPSPLS